MPISTSFTDVPSSVLIDRMQYESAEIAKEIRVELALRRPDFDQEPLRSRLGVRVSNLLARRHYGSLLEAVQDPTLVEAAGYGVTAHNVLVDVAESIGCGHLTCGMCEVPEYVGRHRESDG